MKKLLFIIVFLVIFTSFGFVFGESVEENEGQSLIGRVTDSITLAFEKIDELGEMIEEEVRKRQKIVEDQVRERRDKFLENLKEATLNFAREMVDSIFESIGNVFNF